MINSLKFVLTLFLISSCSILDPNQHTPTFIVDPIIDVETKINSNFYTYTDINKSTGSIISQKYYIGNYWSSHDVEQYHIKDTNGHDLYRFTPVNSVYFDYNNDDKIDMFGFLVDWDGYEPWLNEGKLMLVDDVLDKRQITYYDTDMKYAGMMEVNDFNGDGRMDLLVSNQDGHDLTYDKNRPSGRDFIVYFDDEKNIDIQYIGFPSESAITTGDIDNDGDVDIIQNMVQSNLFYDTNLGAVIPVLYFNDGNGNFTIRDGIKSFRGLKDSLSSNPPPQNYEYEYFWGSWYSNSIVVLDVDGDGFLDYIPNQPVLDNYEDSFSIGSNDSRIYWGDGTGTFDMNIYTSISNTSLYELGDYVEIHSSLLYDFDYDGINDMIRVVNINHDEWYLQFIKNKGDRKFIDVTDEYFDYDTGLDCLNGYELNTFYSLIPHDNDGNGENELLPFKENHFIDCNVNGNMYLDKEGIGYSVKFN